MRVTVSQECTKSELDLFTVPPTQTSIEDGVWDTIQPHPNINDGVIRFDIPATSSHYVDLAETHLYVTAKITNKAGDVKIVDADKTGPVNNFLHSIFSQVEVFLNNTPVENSNSTYAYRAYLENLLCYNKEAKNTFLQGDLFYKDTGDFESNDVTTTLSVTKGVGTAPDTIDIGEKTTGPNKGLIARRKRFLDGKNVEMRGKIHCDIFNINKYLLNNVNVTIKLTKSKESFYLMANPLMTKALTVILDSAVLKVRRVSISPSVMMAHSLALEKTNAKYPIKRVLVKPVTLPFQCTKTTLASVHQGVMPTRVVVGFVDTEAYDGHLQKNPFNFKDFSLTNLTLKVASKAVPYSSGLKLDYANNQYLEGYNSIYQNIREAGNYISYEEYSKGNALYAFDLTPDLCSAEHFSLLQDGALDCDITFSKQAEKGVTAIFYLEFDNIIEITKARQIIFDYKV